MAVMRRKHCLRVNIIFVNGLEIDLDKRIVLLKETFWKQ